jgi:transcription-repair coupling factor (superfamily II helicase)
MNITFKAQSPIDPRRIIELVQKNRAVKLAGNDKLRIDREISAPADRAHYLRDLLKALGQPLPAST